MVLSKQIKTTLTKTQKNKQKFDKKQNNMLVSHIIAFFSIF